MVEVLGCREQTCLFGRSSTYCGGAIGATDSDAASSGVAPGHCSTMSMRTSSLHLGILVLLLLAPNGMAQEPTQQSDQPHAEEPHKNYLIPALEIIGLDTAINRFGYRFVDRETYNVGASSIRRNLQSGWVVDHDEFKVNQLFHPYQGSIYHTAARSAGLGFWTSAAFTFAGSVLWEVAGETTAPSVNDQVASGIGGVFFGEPLFRMANLTMEENRLPHVARALGAAIISPATAFNPLVFGGRFDPVFPGHEPAFFTRADLGAAVAEYRVEGTPRGLRRDQATLNFSMAYGLPGKQDYSYQRPFDYFNFEFTASTSNAFESTMTRGLLVGRKYSLADSYRGVWGLYGSYDYITSQDFRVSTTALSVGTTAQWGLPGPFTFQGSALGGLGYGAGGTVQTLSEQAYHYGLTPQALVSARFILGKVASLDVTGRGYHITRFASSDNGGFENIGRADASLTVRVFGPHAVTVKYLVTVRNARYPDLGVRDQRRDVLGLYYTFLSDKNFGTTDWRGKN